MKKHKLYSFALASMITTSAFSVNAHAESVSYKVQSGDTMWRIATNNHITVDQLKEWNQLNNNLIYLGQSLYVTSPETFYAVKAGDNISGIAKAHNLLIADIKIQNQLTSDELKIGQSLKIPSQKGTYERHTVKPGDSLTLIARDYFVSLSDLKTFNKLSSDVIHVGQVLYLTKQTSTPNPVIETSPITANSSSYTVKVGDTLYGLSKIFKTSVQEIKSLNELTTDMLRVGQVLRLPEKQIVSENKSEPTPLPEQEVKEPVQESEPKVVTPQYATIHVVKSGEYLSVIAKKYNITVYEIKRLNNLTSDFLSVGQELKITEGEMPKPVAPSFLVDGFFPLPKGSYIPFGDTWGNSRQYGGDRVHEGTDIMAPKGTPIYSATNGKIVNYGWSELGGWRISVKTAEGYNVYYAHMSKYAPGLANGVTVKKGQLIGYVGNTGYGSVGTSGKFASHLHFGIYNSNWTPMNPYSHLKYWESK